MDILTDPAVCARYAALWQIPALHYLPQAASTQDLAARLAADGAPGWTLVVAGWQTSGRGRHGRPWHASADACLTFSVILRPNTPESAGPLPLRIGLAVAAAVQAWTPDTVMLKWPNDIVLNDGKLGGILCEGHVQGGDSCVIAGVGLNVRQFETPDAEPAHGLLQPAFLQQHAPATVSRLDLLAGIVDRLKAALAADDNAGALTPAELTAWAARDWLYGRALLEPAPGLAHGIHPDGRLRIMGNDGIIILAASGSVMTA